MTERPSAHAVEFVDVASMAKWIQKPPLQPGTRLPDRDRVRSAR